MTSLQQIFEKITIKVKLNENLIPIIKDLDKEYLDGVKDWLQQKRCLLINNFSGKKEAIIVDYMDHELLDELK